MVRLIGAVLAMMSIAGAACASIEIAPLSAPEIDPASAIAGLTLLGGGLAVLRGRKSRESRN